MTTRPEPPNSLERATSVFPLRLAKGALIVRAGLDAGRRAKLIAISQERAHFLLDRALELGATVDLEFLGVGIGSFRRRAKIERVEPGDDSRTVLCRFEHNLPYEQFVHLTR